MTPQERQAAEDRLAKLKRLRELKAQRAELIDEGGVQSMPSVREAVDAMPSFLTRTADEKQADQARIEADQQAHFAELNEIPRGIMGPAWNDRAKERDIILERQGKTMTAPEAAMVRAVNSAALTLPQHLDKNTNQLVGAAGNEYPAISGLADVGGFFIPGTGVFKFGEKTLRGLKNAFDPGIRAFTGSNAFSRLGRYLPTVATGTAAGVADYTLYEATVGAGTRAAEEGRQPTLEDMRDAAIQAPQDPWAYMGGLVSPLYRAGRGVASFATGGRVSMTPPQRAEWAASVMQRGDARSKAFQMVAKRLEKDGITPEMLTKSMENYYYGGYSTVDEMLFELAEAASSGRGGGQLKQLAVALGSVGGDAQTTARTAFRERRLSSLERLRTDLRKAAGLEGSDFYNYADQLRDAERTLPDYSQPYGQSIADDSWTETIWPDLQTRPASQKAIVEAYDYARNLGELEVAGEISNLLPALGYKVDETGNVVKLGMGEAGAETLARARQAVPQKPSTQALDYIDRMLGDEAEKLRSPTTGGRRELAKGPSEAQTSLRSVVDAETGLDQPRRVVHELKTAQNALDFGRSSAANGTDLETLQREFLREMQKYKADGAQVLGEETATINAALLMGWMRGAEDMISKASNPATAIRQLYGTPRQREKMVQMLMGLDQTQMAQQLGSPSAATKNVSTGSSPETKRLRQVAGGKYGEQGTPRSRGRFDRERIMLDSENQIVGNSQTGQRNEAVQAQGGLQRQINAITDALLEPRQAIKKGVRNTVSRFARPGIFNEDINRELGDILFTGGRGDLQKIIGELETRMPPRNAFAQSSPQVANTPDRLRSQRGAIDVGDGPRRRRDVMRVLRGEGGQQFPVEATSVAPQQVQNAFAEPRSGLMDGPLPVLAGLGLAGTATVAGIEHLMPSEAATEAPNETQPNAFVSSVINNAQNAFAAEQSRIEQGLPRTPGLKPNLAPTMQAVDETANRSARSEESQRRQEYYRWLKRTPGAGTIWTRVHEERADDLRVTPEDRARGVVAKRLQYGYEIPIEALETAPVEELVGGQWVAQEPSQ